MVMSVTGNAPLVQGAFFTSGETMQDTYRAIALVGFYRGEQLVQPGQVFDMPRLEFFTCKGFNQVDHAPPEVKPVPSKTKPNE